jgi:alpha-glucosidase
VYQVYIRSFADGNGDGIGDIAGIRSRLPYLADLGVDAIWVTPWYLSPQHDAGYDVTDYRVIDPMFGTVDEATALIEEAHAHGIRVIPDIVPKHTSIEHEWFIAALKGKPGGPERARYFFRPGRGVSGELPPNNWPSMFGGPAWTRITEPDGTPGEWYLHMHASEQPDLDWDCKEVSDRLESDMRFWFDRGVDGFRIDVARAVSKDPHLPDLPEDGTIPDPHPYQDQPRQHEIYQRWRQIADEYPGDRTFVAEMWSPASIQARYLGGDQLDTAFNIQFLFSAFDAASLRKSIDDTLSAFAPVGAPATWVLSNHDFMRHPNRYGRPAQTWDGLPGWVGTGELDLARGMRRARSAALLTLALPGSVYIYQGDELGLPEVEDLPEDALRDPTWQQSGHTRRGRDGCRVPLPWSGDEPPFGFGPEDSKPWLPQPADWAALTVSRQLGDRDSSLNLYRAAIGIRRANPALGTGDLTWMNAPEGVLAFTRAGFLCIVNLSERPYAASAGAHLLLSSDGTTGNDVLPDSAAWFSLPD